jgi:phosphoribosylanthranilate isomerase
VADLLSLPHLIKVCAVTTVPDAQLVASAGADALGVILAASPRRVALETAAEISRSVEGRLARVAVFRHATFDDVARAIDSVELDAVQIHGGLPDGVGSLVRERKLTLIEALSVDDLDAASGSGDAYLIDGPHPGSGEAHDWRDVAKRAWDRPLIVAGGLTAESVADVLAVVGAWGCDVASGSESSPGVKDRARVESFVRSARQYFESREEHRG